MRTIHTLSLRSAFLVLLVALSSICLAQSGNNPQKHLLVLGEEKGYRHEAVSHAMATIERLGKAHPDVAVTMNNLGMLLAEQGRVGEARRRFERAWKLLRKRLGPNHPNTLAVRKNLERLK